MSGYWERLLADATPRVKDQITSEMGRMPQDVAMTLIKATFADDPLPALRDYPGPVETVTIGDSPYDLHKQLPDMPDEHVDGTSHWVQMDKPETFDRILDAFLVRVDAAEAARRGVPRSRQASCGALSGGQPPLDRLYLGPVQPKDSSLATRTAAYASVSASGPGCRA